MWRADSQEQRSFARVHETNSMMKHYLLQLKFSNRGLSDQSHLMFRHFFVRFVIDAFNLAPVFAYTSALPYTATSSLQAPGSSPDCPAYYTRCYPVGYSRDSLRGGNFLSLSARFSKAIKLGESRSITLFFEGYNLTNRFNLGTNFNTNVDSPATFRKPNGTSLPLRQLQLGGRFDF